MNIALISSLALRVTSCLFRLALRGYSVASLPRSFTLRARILGRFAPLKFSKKKRWSKNFTALTRFARSAASGEARPLALWSLRSLGLCALRLHSQSLRSIGLRARASRSLRSLGLCASRSLPTLCHSQGPKECPCQVSCRLDQNCGR